MTVSGKKLLPSRFHGWKYLIFLETVLPSFLSEIQVVTSVVSADGALAYYANAVHDCLTRKFGDQWIGRGGPKSWLPMLTDLFPIDFFCQGLNENHSVRDLC